MMLIQRRIQDFPTPQVRREPIILTNFSPKLHENEKKLDREEEHVPGAPGPANVIYSWLVLNNNEFSYVVAHR